ncbi:hypothetical protein [Streptomyces sp. WM6386]|uniref:hypothetical protein n=1 Tax=Streptomyces sp. WM6386 TaxID=1415558 RepID=UPI000A791348|nr:hypothetical protein [Streptomyces sp. WM6386]
MAELGRPAPSRADRAAALEPGGMVFAGSPDEIADRILHLHGLLGHTRQILQMDVGGMPQTSCAVSNCSARKCSPRSAPSWQTPDLQPPPPRRPLAEPPLLGKREDVRDPGERPFLE